MSDVVFAKYKDSQKYPANIRQIMEGRATVEWMDGDTPRSLPLQDLSRPPYAVGDKVYVPHQKHWMTGVEKAFLPAEAYLVHVKGG